MAQEPYWITHKWDAALSLIPPGFIDRLLPRGIRRARVMKRLKEQVGRLVISNVENLRWAIYQSIDQAFARFGLALDEGLSQTMAATRGAIRAALEVRGRKSEEVAREVSRLEEAAEELAQIQAALGDVYES